MIIIANIGIAESCEPVVQHKSPTEKNTSSNKALLSTGHYT